ncbi:MAG: ABC transporter ATP-binding protein [Microscillaceae bacterium]|nr:ABC transporter ATP-binding protein [Microscillaceae bacterium]
MKTFFRILGLAHPVWGYALAFFLFAFLSTLFGLANFGLLIPLLNVLFDTVDPSEALSRPLAGSPYSLEAALAWFNQFFAQIVLDYGKMGALQFMSLVLIVSIFFKNLFYYLSMLMRDWLRLQLSRNAREHLFDKVTSLHLGYFSSQRKGDLLSRFTSDVQEVEGAIVFSLDMLLRDPFALLVYFVALFSISVPMTLFTLVLVPVAGGIIAILGRRLRRSATASQESIGRVISILEESLGALRIIAGYNATDYVRQKFRRENRQYIRHSFHIIRVRELASPFSEFAGVLVVVGILLYGGQLILSENSSLTAAEFITYIVLFSQVITPIKSISNALSQVQRGLVAAQRLFEVIDTPLQIKEKPQALPWTSFEDQIAFRNVWFRYEEKWILKDISFTVKKGQKVALVGETGSGKSTIAQLIPRFYEADRGEILLDGRLIQDLSLRDLRQQLGIVTQEAILFNDTIFNNIAFANEQASPAQVEQAARIANAHDFILQTEQGYQTIIGDRGVKLSGGQKQRLTIARAILKNPPILLLDEATSALDTESERLVQDALHQLMQNRTSLVIAHRLSTIQDADKILVLKNGEIIEEGTHLELLQNKNGVYQRLHHLQYQQA